MKNLEKFGVQELDAVEVKSVDGGDLPEGSPWWSYLIAPGAAYIIDGFLEGYHDAMNNN